MSTHGEQDRWFGAGRSTADVGYEAGREAARAAQVGPATKLLLIFCSASYEPGPVLDGICSVTDDSTLVVGGTSMGELAWDGLSEFSASTAPSVAVAALGGAGFEAYTSVTRDASRDRRGAGTAAAAVMDTVASDHKVMLMIVDGLTREQHEIVRGAYSVLGAAVPIVGGCSADNLEYTRTLQFHGTGAAVEVLVDSVVAVGLGSSAPFGVGIDHGWEKHGNPMVVTRSEGGEVFLIDNEPAIDVYLRGVGADRSLLENEAKFREILFDQPLGLSRGGGEDIRVVHSADPANGSLLCLADVPQGALVWTLHTDPAALVSSAGRSCHMAIEALDGSRPIGLLVFDCGARKVKLGSEKLSDEQEAIAAEVGAPFAGFYTFGEIARTRGSRGMHHLTVATLAIG